MSATKDPIYTQESIELTITVKENGAEIVTTYTADALANDASQGKGKVSVTVCNAAGDIINDDNGQAIDHIYARCKTTNGGQFYHTISYGLSEGGTYWAFPQYGVNDSLGALKWRALEPIRFEVSDRVHPAPDVT